MPEPNDAARRLSVAAAISDGTGIDWREVTERQTRDKTRQSSASCGFSIKSPRFIANAEPLVAGRLIGRADAGRNLVADRTIRPPGQALDSRRRDPTRTFRAGGIWRFSARLAKGRLERSTGRETASCSAKSR